MSFDEEEKQWNCGGKASSAKLHLVSSIVRDIGEPCLHQTPTKGSKMLKPEKWQAAFDCDGRVFGFQKVLKLIVLGGVDSSIRAEVWEFLLGCYTLGSTAEYRRQLRVARRERYMNLVKQCQTMHSTIGTGSLAYVVGSKVMDARTLSKDRSRSEAKAEMLSASRDSTKKLESYCEWNTNHTNSSNACQRESSSVSADLVSMRGSTDSGVCDSSFIMHSSDNYNCSSPKSRREAHSFQNVSENLFEFPSLPVTDLFEMSDKDTKECGVHNQRLSRDQELRFGDKDMHSFQINNNIDLIMESNSSPSNDVLCASNSITEAINLDLNELVIESEIEQNTKVGRLRISDIPQSSADATTSQALSTSEERVSEWLWTLHRIVVDVVRTDSHLEFYEDAKNVARMSDILAVYAWIDPATGYCQGMSDLLSPFVVLYEDNADAFWCFEMLLRRMRENFQMDGPIGVLRQLQALWRILELTDREIFAHLSIIGAESLHFAFRMLLVLFRRELSFNEALRMWEMMWAADFDDSVVQELEKHCLEPMVLQLPRDSGAEIGEEGMENTDENSKGHSISKHGNVDHSFSDSNGIKSASSSPFCGLTRSFWSRTDHLQISSTVSSKNGEDIPIFCVGAILIINRQKIIKETRSIDDLIKMFNDKMLKINVRRCVRTAIKLRRKYIYKLIRQKSAGNSES